MTMKPRAIVAAALAAFSVLAVFTPHVAAERGPSTPEERARFVKITRALEEDPLDDNLRGDKERALRWLIEIPDISVKVCSGPLTKLLDTKKNYSPELFTHNLFASAAFIIENPEAAEDDNIVFVAGIEGVLRMYENILKEKPKARHKVLDELIQKRDQGELADYVRQNTRCESGQ